MSIIQENCFVRIESIVSNANTKGESYTVYVGLVSYDSEKSLSIKKGIYTIVYKHYPAVVTNIQTNYSINKESIKEIKY